MLNYSHKMCTSLGLSWLVIKDFHSIYYINGVHFIWTARLVSLTGVKPRRITGLMVIFLYPANQPFSTVTALEYLQTMGAFSPVFGTYLTFFEDRFTDFGPEVSSTTQSCGTVWWSKTDRTFLSCEGGHSKKSTVTDKASSCHEGNSKDISDVSKTRYGS